MRNFSQLLVRYHVFFLFVILQGFSLWFLFRFNTYHHAGFVNSANGVIGGLYTYKNNVTSYITLQSTNDELAAENASLLNKNRNSFVPVNEHYAMINDTLMQQKFQYLAAEVINSSINKQLNYLTIDKGKIEGVKPEMGVINRQGIVGIVKDVSPHFATIVPVVNLNFSAGVKIKRTGDIGLLQWDGTDYQIAQMVDVAKHVPVQVGDTIVTRGNSTVYPDNVLAGIVSKVTDEAGSNYHDVQVKLSVNFSQIHYIYVVTNLFGKEQRELEQTSEGNDAQ